MDKIKKKLNGRIAFSEIIKTIMELDYLVNYEIF